ncbi:MAG: ABC transporter ATPase [Bacteroidia bacterium]|nr:ABC transporter ATPase [Bacteroidia bacterium]
MNLTNFSPESRLWIYQSDRNLTNEEVAVCNNKLADFIPGWTAHNKQLKAGFEILYNRFIVIAIDETQTDASGCGIDKSVAQIKELGQLLHIDFFNRLQLAWLNNESVKSASANELDAEFKLGNINENSIIFNNTISTYGDWQKKWKIPFKESWAYGRVG